jgi:hypothetical protein
MDQEPLDSQPQWKSDVTRCANLFYYRLAHFEISLSYPNQQDARAGRPSWDEGGWLDNNLLLNYRKHA